MPSQASIAKDAALLDEVDPTATLELHRSNLLRLQSNELLNECQLDITSQKWTMYAHEYLQTLAKYVHKFQLPSASTAKSPSRLADKVVEVSLQKKDLTMEPTGWTKHMSPNAGWTKPTGNAQVLPTFTVSVLLPSRLFSAKDYMNHRYHDKRNLVLEHLTIHLQKQSKVLGEIQYQWPDGSDGAPCLKIIPPAAGKKKRFQVCLIVAMETIEWIPSLRLVPNRNNDKHSSRASDMFAGQRYNQSLLDDVRHVYQDDHLAEFLDLSKEVGHTLVLIQVWALQRGLWRNHDGIRAEAMALFVIYLLRTHQMNARMTSIQLLTVVLQALVKINWLGDSSSDQDASTQVRAAFSQGATSVMPGKGRRRDVLVLPLQDETVEGTISESSLAKLYAQQTEESPLTKDDPRNLVDLYADTDSYGLGPVFLDPTMSYNYFGNVSPNYMTLLRSHAAKSLNMIQSRYAFSHLFLRPVRFWSHWDMYIRIPVNKKNKCTWEESIRCLTHTLEVALGNRIRGLRILSTGNGRVETDADEVPHGANIHAINTSHCPIGNSFIVIGVSINPETSQRAVDRGPPSDDVEQGAAFLKLWGKKAQLRRFKDGAIIQAVVWNDTPSTFCNEDRMDGGIVKKIIQHIVELHYSTERIDFALPELLSTVDGVAVHDREAALFSDSFAAQRNVMKAFEALSDFLRTNSQAPYTDSKESSRLGLPLPIDAVEPLSPCLRYSELFPPLPHPLLGGEESAAGKKVPGAVTSDPIKIQLRFGASSKWPTDLKAMGAAKAAMLVQLINGIEELDAEGFDGPMIVTPTYADIGFKGYCFRIIIRADQEIKMLESLQNPSPEASTLLASLIKKHRIASSHHAIVHGVNSLHPSAGAVVRMAKRWIDCHMFSSHFPIELIELLVAKVYTDNESPAGSPCTAAAGFLRFLALISTHNWARDPLIVNPREHISEDDIDHIQASFEHIRGENKCDGPPMFIVAPYDRAGIDDVEELSKKSKTNTTLRWAPNNDSPEWVVVKRASALAKKSFDFLTNCLRNFNDDGWSTTFHETSNAFHAYSILLRIDEDFHFDPLSSSSGADLGIDGETGDFKETAFSRSTRARFLGPKKLRRKIYRNLRGTSEAEMLLEWNPIQSMVASLQEKLGRHALFFYNELAPEVVCILWRPQLFEPTALSIMSSDYMSPVGDGMWKADSLVKRNSSDLIREMKQVYSDFVTAVKVIEKTNGEYRGQKRKLEEDN